MEKPIYHGVARGNVVVLPDGVEIPDGLPVEIRVLESHDAAAGPEPAVDRLQQRLRERGLLREIRGPAPVASGDRTPVPVEGQPLSEMIIEERR